MKLTNKIFKIDKDKFVHAYVSTLITQIVYSFLTLLFDNSFQLVVCAGLIAITIGVLKEVIDYFEPNNIFDFKDLLADAIGVFISMILILLVI